MKQPTKAQTGSLRVLRGGSWSLGARYVRAAYRSMRAPAFRNVFTGFRLVRTVAIAALARVGPQ